MNLKILFVTRDLPFPPIDGLRTFTYHMVCELNKQCISDLVTFSGENDIPYLESIRSYFNEITTIPKTPKLSWAYWKRRFVARVSILPSSVLYYKNMNMLEVINQKLDTGNYDLLYLNTSTLAWYAQKFFKRIPVVIAPLDALSRSLPQLCSLTSNPLSRLLLYEQMFKCRYFEAKYYSFSDACIVVSNRDKTVLLDIKSSLPVHAVPIGVDTNHFVTRNNISYLYDLVFSGNLSSAPNNDAAMSFTKEILPKLRMKYTSLRLGIVGAHPSNYLKIAVSNDHNIVVTGYVQDIAEHITRAKIYVCPVRFGCGMRNNILQAMSAGLPIVTYPINLEEIPVKHREHVMVANNPDEFISCIKELLENQQLRDYIGVQARNFVLSEFSWRQAALKLFNVLNEASEIGKLRLKSI